MLFASAAVGDDDGVDITLPDGSVTRDDGTLSAWLGRAVRLHSADEEGEDALVGSKVVLGDAVLDVAMRIERCVMTTRPQAGGIERELDVLRTINRERNGCVAVGALVAQSGVVRVGDALSAM